MEQNLYFFSTHTVQPALEESVGSLRGEAWFVLATQDPVGQGELDLGVLAKKTKEIMSEK